MLFDVIDMRPKDKEEKEEICTYDLLRFEGGTVYLKRDDDDERASVIILHQFINHFKKMGENGFLRGKALDLCEELFKQDGSLEIK